MLTQTIRNVVAAGVLTVLAASNVHAQELAGSFDQLRVLIKQGDKIDVTDASGRELTGKVAGLSSSSIALIVSGMRRELSREEVDTIRASRADPIADGARLGFGVGAGLGVLVGLIAGAEYPAERLPFMAIIAAVYGGIGAGIGAGADAMVTTKQVIYAKSAGPPARLAVSPLIGRGRAGAMVSIGF